MQEGIEPKVSIITPVLNGEKYIKGCIESVLSQDYPFTEHVFVDGVSKDNTLTILDDYRQRYSERIIIFSGADRGPGDAWNRGIGLATGEILGWLGHDDMLYPGAIGKVVKFFKDKPDAKFVFGECELLNEKDEVIGMYPTGDFDLKAQLNRRNLIPCTSAFYRKDIFDTIGYFEPDGNDYECWLRVAEHFPIHRLQGEVLSQFRIHEEGRSSSQQNAAKVLREVYLASRKHGGSVFGIFSLMYHSYLISEPLKPVLGWSYPFLRKILRHVYLYSVIEAGERKEKDRQRVRA